MATISALYRYPIRGMQAVQSERVEIQDGAVCEDRIGLVMGPDENILNIARAPRLCWITPQIKDKLLTLSAKDESQTVTVEVPCSPTDHRLDADHQSDALVDAGDLAAQWLSRVLGQPARLKLLKRNRNKNLNLVSQAPVLLISNASLDDLNTRLEKPLPMHHFRPNIAVSGVPAFSEDTWTSLKIGAIDFELLDRRDVCGSMNIDLETAKVSLEPRRTLESYRKLIADIPPLFGRYMKAQSNGELKVGDFICC